MAELNTIPNRGYTLAFHDGRLTNYGHSYEMNWNFASYEYAGIIKALESDAFIVEVKNKLVAGRRAGIRLPDKARHHVAAHLRIY